MSSNSDGWSQVTRGSRSNRRTTNRFRMNQSQGPPAMNTRSSTAFHAANFAARQGNHNRFITHPDQDRSTSTEDSSSMQSKQGSRISPRFHLKDVNECDSSNDRRAN